jgi:3-deoxy-7-phosphoheptulonate synthase
VVAQIVVVLEPEAGYNNAGTVQGQLSAVSRPGLTCRIGGRTVVLAEGGEQLAERLRATAGVAAVLTPTAGAPLAQREHFPEGTVVDVGGVRLGDGGLAVIAGPCAVESAAQLRAAAVGVRSRGAAALRGGAFKPRSSPYAFQGLGEAGLRLLSEVGQAVRLPVVTEVVDVESLPLVCRHAQMLQIGTRNAQNFSLLRAAGASGLPVLLKRGFGCTVEEWLQAAEYVLREGNGAVVLCERGIRSFENSTRFTLDLGAVAALKRLSHLPVVVDPSHGVGRRQLVRPMALAAAAAGADGLLIDAHPEPDSALCDAAQAIPLDELGAIMVDLRRMMTSLGRRLTTARNEWSPTGSHTALRSPLPARAPVAVG